MKKKSFAFLGLLLVGILCITGCSFGGDDSSKYKVNLNVPEGMEVKTYTSYDKDYLIIKLKNGKTDVGAYEVKAVYYDENGNKLSDDFESGFNFKNETEMVVQLDMPKENYEPVVPSKIDITFEIDSEYQSVVGADKLYNEMIQTSYTKNGDKINVSVKNTSQYELDTVVAVAFMKKGKILSVEELNGNIEPNKTENEEVRIPENWDSENDELIDFDDVKIFVNEASYHED